MNAPNSNRETVTTTIMPQPAVQPAVHSSRTQEIITVFMETKGLAARTWYLQCVTLTLNSVVKPALLTCPQQIEQMPTLLFRLLQAIIQEQYFQGHPWMPQILRRQHHFQRQSSTTKLLTKQRLCQLVTLPQVQVQLTLPKYHLPVIRTCKYSIW